MPTFVPSPFGLGFPWLSGLTRSELSQTNGFLLEHRDSCYHRDDIIPIHRLYG